MHNYTNIENEKQQQTFTKVKAVSAGIITDTTNNVNRKLQKYTRNKIFAIALSDAYDAIGKPKKADRAYHCADSLLIGYNTLGESKIIKSNYCKLRLCPICSANRSDVKYMQLSNALAQANTLGKYRYIFLTLTVKNVINDDLRLCLEHMLKSFFKLIRKSRFKQSILGFYRTLEITVNKETNTFHPHFHVLLQVNDDYFKENNPLYLTDKDFADLWQSSLGTDYKPFISVNAVKETNSSNINAELTKYTTKASDFIDLENPTITAEIVKCLDSALNGLRLSAFGGALKQADKEYTETDYSNQITNEYCHNIGLYQWQDHHYIIKPLIHSKYFQQDI